MFALQSISQGFVGKKGLGSLGIAQTIDRLVEHFAGASVVPFFFIGHHY